MKIRPFLLMILLALGGVAATWAQTPTYFGNSATTPFPTSGTPTAAGTIAPGTPSTVDPGIQRELQQLSDRHQAEIATALVPVNQHYQASLQDLLKRAQTAHDTRTAAKIEDIIGTLDTLLNRTAWVDKGNYWAHELDFKDNTLTILMRNGGVRQTPYRTRDGMLTFNYDGHPQQVVIAPDRSSITWLGVTFFAK